MRFVGVCSELRGRVVARASGRVGVDTAIGPVVAEGDQSIGAAVVVATRPECIDIAAPGAGSNHPEVNGVEGRVRRVTFHGSRTRLAVDVGAAADFAVEIGGTTAIPTVGDLVRLTWPRALSFAYPDPGA
jgi:ABC-type Fe3+/spermidine/putrescine transport system ATPase subunit